MFNCMSAENYINQNHEIEIRKQQYNSTQSGQGGMNHNNNSHISAAISSQTNLNGNKSMSTHQQFQNSDSKQNSSLVNGVRPIQMPELRDLNKQRTIVRLQSRQNPPQSQHSSPQMEKLNIRGGAVVGLDENHGHKAVQYSQQPHQNFNQVSSSNMRNSQSSNPQNNGNNNSFNQNVQYQNSLSSSSTNFFNSSQNFNNNNQWQAQQGQNLFSNNSPQSTLNTHTNYSNSNNLINNQASNTYGNTVNGQMNQISSNYNNGSINALNNIPSSTTTNSNISNTNNNNNAVFNGRNNNFVSQMNQQPNSVLGVGTPMVHGNTQPIYNQGINYANTSTSNLEMSSHNNNNNNNREVSAEKNMKLSSNINELENEWSKLKRQHNFDSRSQSPFRLYMKQNSVTGGKQLVSGMPNLSDSYEMDENTMFSSGQKGKFFSGLNGTAGATVSSGNYTNINGNNGQGNNNSGLNNSGQKDNNVTKSSQNIIKQSVPLSQINLEVVQQQNIQSMNSSLTELNGNNSAQQENSLNSAQAARTPTSNMNQAASPIRSYQDSHFKNIIDQYANVHVRKTDFEVNALRTGPVGDSNGLFDFPNDVPHSNHGYPQQSNSTHNANLTNSAVYSNQKSFNQLKNEVKVSSPKLNNLKGINSNMNNSSFHNSNSMNTSIEQARNNSSSNITHNNFSQISNNSNSNNSALINPVRNSATGMNSTLGGGNRDVQQLIMKKIHQMNVAKIYLQQDESMELNGALMGVDGDNNLAKSGCSVNGGVELQNQVNRVGDPRSMSPTCEFRKTGGNSTQLSPRKVCSMSNQTPTQDQASMALYNVSDRKDRSRSPLNTKTIQSQKSQQLANSNLSSSYNRNNCPNNFTNNVGKSLNDFGEKLSVSRIMPSSGNALPFNSSTLQMQFNTYLPSQTTVQNQQVQQNQYYENNNNIRFSNNTHQQQPPHNNNIASSSANHFQIPPNITSSDYKLQQPQYFQMGGNQVQVQPQPFETQKNNKQILSNYNNNNNNNSNNNQNHPSNGNINQNINILQNNTGNSQKKYQLISHGNQQIQNNIYPLTTITNNNYSQMHSNQFINNSSNYQQQMAPGNQSNGFSNTSSSNNHLVYNNL